MASTGLLVLSNVKQLGKTLHAIQKYVNSLYIHLNIPSMKTQQPLPNWGRMISQLYVDSSSYCGIDMRILVGSLKEPNLSALAIKPVDMIFADGHFPEVCESLRTRLNISKPTIYLADEAVNNISDYQSLEKGETHKIYESVVMGGTFDRLHVGHKIFLTQGVLRATRRLVVGVTTESLIKSKTLWELILPVEQRISDVRNFLMEIDATLQYDVVPIDDPFGPTKNDPDMDLIVVSAETLRGGEKVNELRLKNNLRPLDIYCIDMVESAVTDGGPKEAKISSSNGRIDLLGTRIRKPEPKPHLPTLPYVIGLTGGIAAGKSKMGERLRAMGATVLDCDKVGHEVYEPGHVCFNKIVNHFGKDIIAPNGHIDRRKLGAIVFKDPKELHTLNNLVWPDLIVEVKRRVHAIHDEHKTKVVIIEAAVLLQAGWESECHEVWSMMIPPELAVERIMQRNGLSAEEAQQRISSQLHNNEVVAKSDVIFSSQWSDEFTQQQAQKAWHMLMREIECRHGKL